MNRRSFFSSLAALAGAASLSPNIFIPKFEPVKWKRNPKWIVNPDWVNADPRTGWIMPVFDGKNYFGEWVFVTDNDKLLQPF